MMLDNIDRLSAQIDKLTAQVEELIAPFERQVAQLDGITGVGRCAAQDLHRRDRGGHGRVRHPRPPGVVGEVLPPGEGIRRQAKGPQLPRGKANRYIAGVLGEASVSVGRTQTRLGARYRRLAKRRGKAKAQVAVGNTILTIAYALLSDPTADYHDLGADYYEAHTRHHHQVNNHLHAPCNASATRSRSRPLAKRPEPPSPITKSASGLRPERGSAPHPGPTASKRGPYPLVIFGPGSYSKGHLAAVKVGRYSAAGSRKQTLTPL